MSALTIIVVMVVAGTVLVLGVLIGASIHREAMRLQRRHNERERTWLEHERFVLEQAWRRD